MSAIFKFFLGGIGKWLALGLAVVGLLWAVDHYRASANLNAVKLERAESHVRDLEAQKKLLEDTAVEWAAALQRADELASDTAAERALENARLSKNAADTSATKEGIRHAPGADDSFVFSDTLYGFMRQRPVEPEGGVAEGPAASAPGVDRR